MLKVRFLPLAITAATDGTGQVLYLAGQDAEQAFARHRSTSEAERLEMRSCSNRKRHSLDRETIELATNEFGFCNGICQGNGAGQRNARFIEPVQIFEQRATQPVQIEVGIQLAF